jgi:type VI secretion system protein ImpC
MASMCHAPFIAGASPEMFGIESFQSLSMPRDIARVFDSTLYASWKSFRGSEDAAFVGLALPRILLRAPYGARPEAPGEEQHVEDVRSHTDLLWGNAAFAFATCVTNAFTRYGWPGAIQGWEGGGLVEGLPTWPSDTDDEGEVRSGVEVMITDRREKELVDLGFLVLLAARHTDWAAFFSVPSCRRPSVYTDDAATANSRLMCELRYVLTASRFMHYFKVMARDRLGSYRTRGEWEQFLNKWAGQYVNHDDQVSPAIRARYPLREAHIEVSEDPGKPGVYRIIAFLRPYFQLDELSVSLRVVGQIP